jgi:shikimate dehydrogenase
VRARERPSRLVILGHPVAHSLSPVFQTAALRHLGFTTPYERCDVAPTHLIETMAILAREGGGGNVTIPHKEAVAALAQCTAVATRVGAVNTFWHDGDTLVGHNTDVDGARATIRALVPGDISSVSCAVIGAGGSAAAVLVALDDLGCRDIRITSRTLSRAVALIERLQSHATAFADPERALDGATLVINASPVGMTDNAMPVAPAQLAVGAAVLDLVYRPHLTAWVRACRAAGHPAEDGARMLLEQGAAAFECWFGVEAPRAVMAAALHAARAGP